MVVSPAAGAKCASCEHLPLEFTNLSPPIGTTFTEGASEVPCSMNAAHGLAFVTVYIASNRAVGSDGRTLSDINRVDSFSLLESSTHEGFYQSVSGVASYLHAGTYYWQMEAVDFSALREYQTPIHSFVIAPKSGTPPSPTQTPTPAPYHGATASLTASEGYRAVKEIILFKTKKRAHHLKDHCSRMTVAEVVCKGSWSSASHLSARTMLYAGRFTLRAQANKLLFVFTGKRERVACARRHSVKHCASRVHWHS